MVNVRLTRPSTNAIHQRACEQHPEWTRQPSKVWHQMPSKRPRPHKAFWLMMADAPASVARWSSTSTTSSRPESQASDDLITNRRGLRRSRAQPLRAVALDGAGASDARLRKSYDNKDTLDVSLSVSTWQF